MEPSQLDSVLETVEQQTIQSALGLLRGRIPVTPAAFGVAAGPTGEPTMVLIPLLDLQQRFQALRQAVERSKVDGFVFAFDGVLKGQGGAASDAILIVTCTRHSRRARAVPYRHTVEGLHVGDPLDAPDEIAEEYQRVLDVHPQPHPPGR